MRARQASVESFLPPAAWFDRWWEPHDFLAEVRVHSAAVPRVLLFTRPELKQLREALVAALFANVRCGHTKLQIRLEADRFPDFQIQTAQSIERFELVEADRPGRRRGQEYRDAADREAAGLMPEVELFDPDQERKEGIEAIGRAIKHKIDKRYSSSPHLLVYVNFLIFEKVSFSFSEADTLVDLCREQFPSVWLLWADDVAQIWPRVFRIRRPS